VIAEYASQRLAADALGMGPSSISECVRGNRFVNGLRLCPKRPNSDYLPSECEVRDLVTPSSNNGSKYTSSSSQFRGHNLTSPAVLGSSECTLLSTSAQAQMPQGGASGVRAAVERLLIHHGWIPREPPASGNSGNDNRRKKGSRDYGRHHDNAVSLLQRQQQWAPPPNVAAVAPSGYALVESSVAAVRLHGGVVIDGLSFASPQQVWPLLQKAVDTSSADFVTSDPLRRPPDDDTAGNKAVPCLDGGDAGALPDGVVWSAHIERYVS